MITIDGGTWDVPCSIERRAELKPSEISGMLLDKSYFNDVIGTYLTYDVRLAVPHDRREDYATLHDTLTDPVDAHHFVMPYNLGTVEITARVESVRDVWVYVPGQANYWRGVKFTVIANHPTKEYSLDDVMTRGRTPFPEGVSIPIGALYEMTADGWERTTYDDADAKRY